VEGEAMGCEELICVANTAAMKIAMWIEGCISLAVGGQRVSFVRPNVRAKLAPAAWCAGQQAQNGPQAQRLMTSVPRRWGSA